MNFQFTFNGQTYTCNNIPADYKGLAYFLTALYNFTLPSSFFLYHVTPDGQNIPLNTEEHYQRLRSIQSPYPIQILITDKELVPKENRNPDIDQLDFEVVAHDAEKKDQFNLIEDEKQEDEIILQPPAPKTEEPQTRFERIVHEITEENIMEKFPPRDMDPDQQEQLRKEMKTTIQEQLPMIISRVKEALLKEGLVVPINSQPAPLNPFVQYYQAKGMPMNQGPPPQLPKSNSHPEQGRIRAQTNALPVYQGPPPQPPQLNPQSEEDRARAYTLGTRPRPNPFQARNPNVGQQEPDFEDKMMKAFGGITRKAAEMLDNLTHKIDGDPYMYCQEGKYKKSTVERVQRLNQKFPNEKRKDLLDFTEKYPKEISVDELAAAYNFKKQGK